jgi:uncharacterized protein YcsI (UPF0317 family)
MTVFAAPQQAPLPPIAGREDILPSLQARLDCRAGMASSTAGIANGFVQGNLAILPEKLASSFHRFCQLNPKPCPIIGISDVGDPRIPALGADLDICTDVPRYRVWLDGEVIDEPSDIMAHWRDDLVAFVLGCSFSFEEALMEEGLPIRHIERNVRVPMYRTNIACHPSGPFAGPMVVSMRPFKPRDAIRAVQITSRFPAVHGAPVHLGHPHLIGISDITKPDYGDAVPVEADEIPVFWACGVTPQAVIASAKLPFAITHAPGMMLITDLRNKQFAVI